MTMGFAQDSSSREDKVISNQARFLPMHGIGLDTYPDGAWLYLAILGATGCGKTKSVILATEINKGLKHQRPFWAFSRKKSSRRF